MNDNHEVDALRAEVADLKRRLHAHENLRSGAIDALGAINTRMDRIQARLAGVTHPVLAAAREESAPALFGRLSARLGASEEWLRELSRIMIEDHDLLQEILAMLRSQGGPRVA
jgi:hypothetical protein